jgi:signal transduction histidine kinase
VERLSAVTKLKFSFITWEDLQKSQKSEWNEALSLSSTESVKITVQDEFRLAGYTIFFDWEKRPALALRVEFNRDIMRQGIDTIQTIMLTIVVFGLCFGVALVLLLEKSVLRRITRLAKEAEKVGNAGENLRQVTIQGSDEIGLLSKSINKMLGSLQDQSNNLRAISENAPIGLLRCDSSGSILDGYSRSCIDLLDSSIRNENLERSMAGMKIWIALGLGKRDSESFQVFYDQVFENSIIGVELIENLPRKINLNNKTLDLTISPIMSSCHSIDSLLFSIADISGLEAVERENMSNQALLRILRNLERFKDLVKRVMNPLSIIGNGDHRTDSELNTLRRSLHTWKGEFAAFGLKDFVSRIHMMESMAETTEQVKDFLGDLREGLNHFLVQNQSILNILPKDMDATLVVVNQNRVDRLRKDMDSSPAPEHKAIVLQFLRDLNHEEASKIFHYLKDGAHELARRLEKQVFVQIDGEEVKLPNAYREVYSTFVHIVRNAIDHGIERPSERGAKNPTGSLRMEAKEWNGFYKIRISDDGKGIDLKTVRHIALSRGLTTEKEWATLSESERLAFVLRNGFSTKRDVTYVSGRGIGLDAVQSTLRRWGGSIQIESRPGWGTSFTIYLPQDVVEMAAA